jgi:hypothetical protein
MADSVQDYGDLPGMHHIGRHWPHRQGVSTLGPKPVYIPRHIKEEGGT